MFCLKAKPKISIIIVNWNSKSWLKICIDSIYRQTKNLSFEIIIIDNASSDGSSQMVREKFPKVILTTNKRNLGFAKANNQALKSAKGKYILLLNPDTVILDNALEKMVKFMDSQPDAGVVGPKLLNRDGTVQFSCRHFYNLRTILLRRTVLGKIFSNSNLLQYHLMSTCSHNEVREVDWVLGSCLIIRRKVLNWIGYLDEKYKMYFEDVDLCYRVKKVGYKVYYYPEAIITHYHQRESAQKFSKKTIWHIQSAIRFFNKYGWKF